MNKVRNGTIEGLVWYEIPKGAPDGGDLIVVTRNETPPTRAEARRLTAESTWRYGLYAVNLEWFRPFDAAKEFPGRTVRFREKHLKDAGVTEWMHEHLAVPAELDLRIEHRREEIHLVARTMRKGLEVQVARRMRTDVPFPQALEMEMPYLMRHCRRPPDGPGIRCRSYLNEMTSGMTDHALRMFTAWVAGLSDPKKDSSRKLKLPGCLMRAEGVEEVVLSYDARLKSIRGDTVMTGGHHLDEDDTGLELVLAASLPSSMRLAVVGRPLSDVIGPAWAGGLRVKTVRNGKPEEPTSMRIHCDGEPLRIPVGSPLELEDAERIMERLGQAGRGGRHIQRISATAIQALEEMDASGRATALSITSIFDPSATLDLGPFGRTGWMLQNQGGTISATHSPAIPYDDAMARLAMGSGK